MEVVVLNALYCPTCSCITFEGVGWNWRLWRLSKTSMHLQGTQQDSSNQAGKSWWRRGTLKFGDAQYPTATFMNTEVSRQVSRTTAPWTKHVCCSDNFNFTCASCVTSHFYFTCSAGLIWWRYPTAVLQCTGSFSGVIVLLWKYLPFYFASSLRIRLKNCKTLLVKYNNWDILTVEVASLLCFSPSCCIVVSWYCITTAVLVCL